MRTGIYILLIVVIFNACVVSQSKREKQDRSYTSYILKNKDRIKDAAALAIELTWDKPSKEFESKSVRNKKDRKLLAGFGSTVIVHYSMRYDEVYDSTVIFKTIDFSGVHEIIYCFAAKSVERVTHSTQSDALIKVADNIYYARRPFPLM